MVKESYPWVEKQVVQDPIFEPWQRAVHDSILDVLVSKLLLLGGIRPKADLEKLTINWLIGKNMQGNPIK